MKKSNLATLYLILFMVLVTIGGMNLNKSVTKAAAGNCQLERNVGVMSKQRFNIAYCKFRDYISDESSIVWSEPVVTGDSIVISKVSLSNGRIGDYSYVDVTAVKPGNSTLTITDSTSGSSIVVNYTVVQPVIKGLPDIIKINVGKNVEYNLSTEPVRYNDSFVLDSLTHNYDISCSVDNTAICSIKKVFGKYTITALSAGSTYLNASVDGTDTAIRVPVIVEPLSIISNGITSFNIYGEAADLEGEQIKLLDYFTTTFNSSSGYKPSFDVSVSDTSVVTVDDDLVMTGKHRGKCSVTVKLQGSTDPSAALTFSVSVYDQTKKATLGKQIMAYSNSCDVVIAGLFGNNIKKIRLYRSTKKNKGYKLVKTSKYDFDHINFGGDDGVTVKDKKKLSPNKKYYYKLQVMLDNTDTYGPISDCVEYYTAPKKDVKVHRTSSSVSWKKQKGVSKYVVHEFWTVKLGYNIFFQPVYGNYSKVNITSGTSFKRYKSNSTIHVEAVSKHNGRYFWSGTRIIKNASKWKADDFNKSVG